MLQIKKRTANLWEYKVVNNANIANFVRLWKPESLYRIHGCVQVKSVRCLQIVSSVSQGIIPATEKPT